MREIKFQLEEKSQNNRFYILLNWAGGDADTEHPEYHTIEGVTFSNYKDYLELIEKEVEKYKTLQNFNRDDEYDQIKEEYGEEIAILWDNAPNDPVGDYQWKCYLSSIELVGYDEQGDKYISYV